MLPTQKSTDRPVRARDYLGHVQLARRIAGRGNIDRAVEEVQRALELDPSRPEAFNVLGVFRELSGALDDAERCYRRALDLAPDYEAARHNLARLARHPADSDIWMA